MIAFSALSYLTGEPLSDSSYFRWIIDLTTKTGDNVSNKRFVMHRCTDKDFTRFYPPVDEATRLKVSEL